MRGGASTADNGCRRFLLLSGVIFVCVCVCVFGLPNFVVVVVVAIVAAVRERGPAVRPPLWPSSPVLCEWKSGANSEKWWVPNTNFCKTFKKFGAFWRP